jgi:hypothetical protein
MSKHSPEPWGVIGTPGGWTGVNSARDGLLFKLVYNNEGNAHRAVECVNGCADIESPATTVPELVEVCKQSEAAMAIAFAELLHSNTASYLLLSRAQTALLAVLAKTGKKP